MVDGGLAYERYGARDGWDTIETMFEYKEVSDPQETLNKSGEQA